MCSNAIGWIQVSRNRFSELLKVEIFCWCVPCEISRYPLSKAVFLRMLHQCWLPWNKLVYSPGVQLNGPQWDYVHIWRERIFSKLPHCCWHILIFHNIPSKFPIFPKIVFNKNRIITNLTKQNHPNWSSRFQVSIIHMTIDFYLYRYICKY